MDKENKEKIEDAGTGYIALSEAAKIAGCTPEHLNLMARKKKLKADKIGRNWFTKKEWLNSHIEAVKKNKNLRKGIIAIRMNVDNFLNLSPKKTAGIAEEKKYKIRKNEIYIRQELESAGDKIPVRYSYKKSFATTAAAAVAVLFFLLLPAVVSEIKKDNIYEKYFSDIENAEFISEDSGIVLGEETGSGTDGARSAAYASENYKIKQIRFGGLGAEAAALSDENVNLKVENVRSETFMTKKQDEAKLVVYWTTNKLAVSEIEYSKNSGADSKKIKEQGYGFSHGLVIPKLELGQAYVYKITAKDRWGNVEQTGSYALYSGTKTVSVIELIAKEFEKMFEWAKR